MLKNQRRLDSRFVIICWFLFLQIDSFWITATATTMMSRREKKVLEKSEIHLDKMRALLPIPFHHRSHRQMGVLKRRRKWICSSKRDKRNAEKKKKETHKIQTLAAVAMATWNYFWCFYTRFSSIFIFRAHRKLFPVCLFVVHVAPHEQMTCFHTLKKKTIEPMIWLMFYALNTFLNFLLKSSHFTTVYDCQLKMEKNICVNFSWMAKATSKSIRVQSHMNANS